VSEAGEAEAGRGSGTGPVFAVERPLAPIRSDHRAELVSCPQCNRYHRYLRSRSITSRCRFNAFVSIRLMASGRDGASSCSAIHASSTANSTGGRRTPMLREPTGGRPILFPLAEICPRRNGNALSHEHRFRERPRLVRSASDSGRIAAAQRTDVEGRYCCKTIFDAGTKNNFLAPRSNRGF